VTIYLDSSALLAWHIDGASRGVVHEELQRDVTWCASAISLTEALAAVSRLTDDDVLRREFEDNIRDTWDFIHVVPLDQRCLDDAVQLMTEQPIGVSTALHLVAAQRLPADVTYVTFDAAHIPVALSLGFNVVSG
jgi:predicted nucleic acid-binding protein